MMHVCRTKLFTYGPMVQLTGIHETHKNLVADNAVVGIAVEVDEC